MAYYPGNYYHSRLQHIGDYYSQGLFGVLSPHIQFDPYTTDSHYRDDDDHPPYDRPRTPSLPRVQLSPPTMIPPVRLRTPPRPSPPPPLATTAPSGGRPSPAYLDFASKPSKALSSPTRKLLILDLNGTLLLRSPRPPKSPRAHHRPHPAPRRVMPRPYLAALRAYLFAPPTRAWLDVMVWSSAQPHSVEDMVLHALGDDRESLVAIWARDTLGLAEDYHRKVQTTKDLAKPWEALKPRRLRAAFPTPSSSNWTGHSAATTILLDDSHAKAALQPHNHLCVPEYTREQRNTDLAVLQLERATQHLQQQEDSATAHAVSSPDSSSSSASASTPTEKEENVLKRKRQKKEKAKKKARTQAEQQVAAAAAANGLSATYDETLLAVIGVLHAARLQSSIAGWLRAGALFLPPSSGCARGDGDGDDRDAMTWTWCDDPVLVRAWASGGREAMRELGLKVDHGVEA